MSTAVTLTDFRWWKKSTELYVWARVHMVFPWQKKPWQGAGERWLVQREKKESGCAWVENVQEVEKLIISFLLHLLAFLSFLHVPSMFPC